MAGEWRGGVVRVSTPSVARSYVFTATRTARRNGRARLAGGGERCIEGGAVVQRSSRASSCGRRRALPRCVGRARPWCQYVKFHPGARARRERCEALSYQAATPFPREARSRLPTSLAAWRIARHEQRASCASRDGITSLPCALPGPHEQATTLCVLEGLRYSDSLLWCPSEEFAEYDPGR
jgi:hypothetical protein